MSLKTDEAVGAVRDEIASSSPALGAFDYLLENARACGFIPVCRISAVKSVELQWPHKKQNPFSVQVGSKHINFYLRRPILSTLPHLLPAAVKAFGPVKPNRLGEYRTRLYTRSDAERLLEFLRERDAWDCTERPA